MSQNTPQLVARDPSGPPVVAVIGRISTPGQDIENIQASYRYVDEYLRRLHDGPLDIMHLGEQASGMLADRETMQQVEQLVAAGRVDLVIAEDLSRIYRNPRLLYSFVQDCVDAGTRVIGIGDNVDTGDEQWEVLLGAAAFRHGTVIPDTRRRVRRTATNSFHNGGMVLRIRYGYRKLSREEAASGQFGPVGLRVMRLDECTPIIREMKVRLVRGDLPVRIADWLNETGVPAGPYVEDGRWSARLVADFIRDPILAGIRTFRDIIYRPIFSSGHYRRERNQEPEHHHHPELAHLTPEEHAEILLEIERRKRNHAEDRRAGRRPRNLPRSASYWPGQAAHCGACGALMHVVGNHLKCSGSLRGSTRCWMHVQVPIEMMRDQVIGWLSHQLTSDDRLRATMVEAAWEALVASRGRHGGEEEGLAREIRSLERRAENFARAIEAGVTLENVLAQSQELQAALEKARRRQQKLQDDNQSCGGGLTREQLPAHLDATIRCLAATSYEFAEVLRPILQVTVIPMQALDTPQIRPRISVVLQPTAPPSDGQAEVGTAGTPLATKEFDLFEPPVHIRHLRACVASRDANPSLGLRKLAERLGIGYMTVKRALRYARLMEEAGLDEPYRQVVERPAEASRWRRRRTAG